MKYINEYRDSSAVQQFAQAIKSHVTRPWTIMEICGGQTHSIVRFGLEELLPSNLTLVHGPGCPVCVTPIELIDKAIQLALKPEVILCSFGDMLRVPGSEMDLLSAKARGGDVRIVYSPLDAVKVASENPQRQVVFFAIGFETTAPPNAMAVAHAQQRQLRNFSLLVSHVLVPPAMGAVLSSPANRVQAFLAAGHVCTVMGLAEYYPIAEKYRIPIVATGFEPLDIMQGLFMATKQLEEGRAVVENQYTRMIRAEGNPKAQDLVHQIFEVVDRKWRGIGEIPRSGLGLRTEYANYDAEKRFGLQDMVVPEPADCQAGLVLQGVIKPHECPAFGVKCTPEHPLGAPMVSSEGACSAYFKYKQPAALKADRQVKNEG